MKTTTIMLKSIDDVKNLVNLTARFSYDIDLRSHRYVVDGKSIMGVLSLDHSKPIEVTIHSDDCDELLEGLKAFAC